MADFDVVVIGAGPGGEKAAIRATEMGAKVAIIEKNNMPGGTSVLTGTIPSKAIRETACYINLLTKKELHGFSVHPDHKISVMELFHRHHVISDRRAKEIFETFNKNNITYFKGHAKFLDQHKIEVLDDLQNQKFVLTAKKFIIAVGSRPFRPNDIEFDGKLIFDSESILQLEKIPDSILIYGGGVIGCEYASIFAALGVEVFLISPQQQILSFIDFEIGEYLKFIYTQMGVKIFAGRNYQTVEANKGINKVALKLESGPLIKADFLLYANGRQGNANALNLQNCGLVANHRYQLDVNKNYQTAVSHIYAVGDVIGFPALASVANEQGRIAATHAVNADYLKSNFDNIPIGIYTIPEIAMIGETEYTLKEKNVPYKVGRCYFNELARSELVGEEQGLLKLIVSKDNNQILGVHIIGHLAADLVHIGQAVMRYKGTVEYFIEETFNFPTFSSAYKVAARKALGYDASK